MKFEGFVSGSYKQQYQYKSFQPSPINHVWSWDDPRQRPGESDFYPEALYEYFHGRNLTHEKAYYIFIARKYNIRIRILIFQPKVRWSRIKPMDLTL